MSQSADKAELLATFSSPVMSFDSKFSSFDNIPPSAGADTAAQSPSAGTPRAPIIIFGSQGSDFLAGFDIILALSRHHPELAAFLAFALDAVRAELQSVANRHSVGLSASPAFHDAQRESEVELLALLPPFEPFSDLKTLVDFHRRNDLKDPITNGVLLCLLQTAQVVAAFCASQQNEQEQHAPVPAVDSLREAWAALSQPCSHLLGFCTGALSAFTVRQLVEDQTIKASPGIWSYAQEAVKAIRICLWISLRSAHARRRLAQTADPDALTGHWSFVVAVKDPDYVEKVYLHLSSFNELEQRRPLDQPVRLVVTARAVNQISIGGPPRQLERFEAHLLDSLGSKCRISPLEIFSPYHSPDLEVEADLVMIDLERRGLVDNSILTPSQKILWETADANILAEADLRGTWRALVGSNLSFTADWDAMIDHLVLLEGELPDATYSQSGVIVSFGPGTHLATDLRKRLSSQQDPALSADVIKMLDVPSLLRDWMASAAHSGPRAPISLQPDVHGEEIVVVSMACRFPGDVRSPEQLWTCLETGRSTVTEIPKHLFDIDAYFGSGTNQTLARHMHALPEDVVKSMDARLFSMSPKEIEQLDPQHRLVMLCSYEALERAGYSAEANSPSSFDGKRIAVCMGASWDDYRENASWNIGSYFITGNIRAFIPGHVAFSLKWEGPSVSVDSLECSAVSAIQWSRRALLSGQCDVALAGAVNVLTQPQIFVAMDKEGILSHSGTNATFSHKLDGKTRGDGCGILLLKRRSTALRDGDKILATLPAANTSYHGRTQDTAGSTSADQSDFLSEVISEAGLRVSDLVHIEANGSHTQQEEAAEFDSFSRLLANAKASSAASSDGGISVTSSRPNIGAGEAVSAIASVMKAVLMFEKGVVPRQISISHPSELQESIAATCANSPLFVPTQAQLLPASRGPGGRRVILVNSLASTGCHGAVLVGAPTLNEELSLHERSSVPTATSGDECAWIFVLSAKTKEAGAMLKKALIDYLQRDVCLADLSYTLACRRTHHPFRLSVVASDKDELIRCLRGAEFTEAKPAADLPGFGLLFKAPDPSSVRGMTALFDLTWSLRDRLEDLTSAIHSFGAPEDTRKQLDLLQICQASLLDDCGVHPVAVSGRALPALLSGRHIDEQIALRMMCGGSILHAECPLSFAAPKDAAKLLLPDGGTALLSSDCSLALEQLDQLTQSVKGQMNLPSSYRWIEIGSTVEVVAEGKADKDLHPASSSEAQILQRSLLSSLGYLHEQGHNIRWIEYFRPHLPHLQHINELPTYPFHLQQYWMEYHDRNLLPHVAPDSHAQKMNETSLDAAAAEDQANFYEPLMQPLLTEQIAADGHSCTYSSDLTDDAQAALLKVVSPFALAVELLSEAVWEASETEVAKSFSLNLSQLQLQDCGRGLSDAQEVLLSVIPHQSSSSRSEGRVQLHIRGLTPLAGSCDYLFLSKRAVDNRLSRLQSLILEKVGTIEDTGERLSAKFIYKGILGSLQHSTRSIRRSLVQAQSREAIFYNSIARQDMAAVTRDECVLALLLGTLEECARWVASNLCGRADDEHGVVGIEDVLIREEWLETIRESAAPSTEYMVFVRPSQADDSSDLPDTDALLDMLLLDDGSRVVGELHCVRLAKLGADSSRPAPKPDTVPAAPIASDSRASSIPAPAAELKQQQQPTKTAHTPPQRKLEARSTKLHAQVLEVLASELGIAVEEMQPSVKFADLGLDSLMSLVCISTLETLDLGFTIPQSLFMEYDSPGELLSWVQAQLGDEAAGDDVGSDHVHSAPLPKLADSITPAASAAPAAPAPGDDETTHAEQATQPPVGSAVEDAMRTITTTIETELGVASGSIDTDANLADLGLDSLMSLLVLGNLAGTLPVELPASLFMECTSLREIRAFLTTILPSPSLPTLPSARDEQCGVESSVPAAKPPVLLRAGTDAGCSTPLFLLPDGSGMSVVYASLPAIERPIYGVSSPFLANAAAWSGGVRQLARYYLACMRLVQPEGPWLVGGWSFGGMVAFEIASILSMSGGDEERVAGLVLLDTPSPVYPPLPMSIVDWIFTEPAVKDIAPPTLGDRLVAHFRATVDNLAMWQPTRFQEGGRKVPHTWYVVADDALPGRMENIREVNETIRWLFRPNRAKTNGADGWDAYIPADRIEVVPVPDANHFTLVREPHVVTVAKILQDACRSALKS